MRVVMLALITVGLLACGSVPPASSSTSGSPASTTGAIPTDNAAVNVRGTIDRGAAPSCPPGEPCDPAITAAFVVFSQPGKPDVRVRVGANGAFAVHLDPGIYSVSAAPALNGTLEPNQLRVPSTGTVELHLVVRRPA